MKICCICKIEKEITDFNKNKTKPDGLQSHCKECGKIRSAKHYKNNKQDYIESNLKRQRLLMQFVWDYLKEHPCIDCKETDPIVLEFDHVKDVKIENVGVMIHKGVSLEKLQTEIAKCEVRCSNCHKRRTAKQFDWYKDIVK